MEQIQDHHFLSYNKNKPGKKIIRILARDITCAYLQKEMSISQLKKLKKFTLNVKNENKTWRSKEISYDIIEKYLSDNNKFDYKAFDLFEIRCPWLDGNIDISTPQHFVGSDGKSARLCLPLAFGDDFPIKPILDREGWIFNSFQSKLFERILVLHNRLVLNSNKFNDPEWLFDFLGMISNCVSIVDILLNQIYIKAEYDPPEGWVFDKTKLGERNNRRIKDKLEWVKLIVGKPLDTIEHEVKSLKILKNLRNHTQHFDPPCFGFTMEDVTIWMNMIHDIGLLVYKIRDKIGSKFNEKLLEIILLPEVEFNGVVLFNRDRLPHVGVGYETTCWPHFQPDINDI